MCGISGIFEPGRETAIDRAVLKGMTDALRHRGPDDEGFYCGPGIGLGHRRLSIIDLKGGHQPIPNEDESIWVMFNGEIYNFQELNRRYLASGHCLRTRSDTETIVHLYEELGEGCFAELRGMFAIALWDGRKRKLILARDRVGKKPLFYSWDGRRLLFGSEIKALLAAGGLSTEMDLEALSDYFSLQYIPAPKTIYRSVRKLRPGHYLAVEGGTLREVAYWDLSFHPTRPLAESEWCDSFVEEFRTSVKSRLISEVPLGAFLSGGVDSSSVVAVMNDYQPPVTTCSIGFTEASYDEARDARLFASSLGARHFERIVNPSAIDLLPKLAWHYDEPFADSSAVPTYYVSQVAREHVTVALSGDGGDENFAGYSRYRFNMWENSLRALCPLPIRKAVFGTLGQWYPALRWAPRMFRGKYMLETLARTPLEGYFNLMSLCPQSMKKRLFTPEVGKALAGYDSIEVFRQYYDHAPTEDMVSRIQYVDIKTYLVDDILVKVDRASMAHSLEVRCPLLDHKLMEMAAQIPSSLKLRNGQGKYIFKKALEGILPAEVLTRPKQGFAVPVAEWFRGELKQTALEALFGKRDDLLNRQFLNDCWNQHQRGHRDWSPLLWSVLMLRMWQEVQSSR
jgi:asparagine synthase (glutamine-hydrolysing)